MHPEAYLDRLASTKQVSDLKNIIRGPFSSILLTFLSVSAYLLCINVVFCVFHVFLCISMISKVWKRRETLFGVDLSKNFGVSSVLDMFGEGNDVLQILIIICTTAGVEIKIEPLNSCSLRAAKIQRSDFYVIYKCICIYIYIHICIYASMHLCI